MNSLNILSNISSTTPQSSRSSSPAVHRRISAAYTSDDTGSAFSPPEHDGLASDADDATAVEDGQEGKDPFVDEKSALLGDNGGDERRGASDDDDDDLKPASGWTSIPGQISGGIVGAVKVVVAWITSPCKYIVAYFYDQDGTFSPLLPFLTIARAINPRKRKRSLAQAGGYGPLTNSTKPGYQDQKIHKRSRRPSSSTSSTGSDNEKTPFDDDSPARHTRSKSSSNSAGTEDSNPNRRSIRIKFRNEDSLKRRRRTQESDQVGPKDEAKELVAASLKSPSSPTALKITKFPRAPQPPRPLVPRRQPSYSKLPVSHGPFQKTLILDLDETLIHSVSKGGRYATGHMVEVRMPHPVGYGGVTIGPEVPILYYVHKRPHCDEFLRKVSKWYNLVIFTASVPQYADPVIDWLEMEKKYFSARYYRQHCTYRNGAYIKDLSQVEDDLRNVMIIDNTPQCYIFHEDNAVPIEGWINDPTDTDLLHLIPLLEGLQYATDVRALLALRLGQPQVDAS